MSLKFAGALVGMVLLAGAAAVQAADTTGGASADKSMLVEALFRAQQPPDSKALMSRDEIAALKADKGWGNVFKDLKAQGYYPGVRNFGDLVSTFRHEQNELRRQDRPAGAAQGRTEKVESRIERRAMRIDRPMRPERVERPERPGHFR